MRERKEQIDWLAEISNYPEANYKVKSGIYLKKYNRLTIISPLIKYNNNIRYVYCRCSCGVQKFVILDNVKSGGSKSCGCLNKEQNIGSKRNVTHGKTKTKLYGKWTGMKDRCLNKNSKYYKNYGERGITICKEWNEDFLVFEKWAFENRYTDSKKLYLDRIDNDGNYCPENCRWINVALSNINKNKPRTRYKYRSKYKGVISKTLKDGTIRWVAYIKYNNKSKQIGTFDTEQLAGLAYNRKAAEVFGEYACLNIIEEDDNDSN